MGTWGIPSFRQTNLGSKSRQKKMNRHLAQIWERKLVVEEWPKVSSADVCWLFSKVTVSVQLETLKILWDPYKLSKLIFILLLWIASQPEVLVYFQGLRLSEIGKLPKIFFPKYWHIASSEVKYGSCLSTLCLFTIKEVFTWNFNFVIARIPIQPDTFFFFLTLLNMSIGFSVSPTILDFCSFPLHTPGLLKECFVFNITLGSQSKILQLLSIYFS